MLAVILVVAAGLRVWAPWDDVLGGARVNFLETDALYHVRLAESQVRMMKVVAKEHLAKFQSLLALAMDLHSAQLHTGQHRHQRQFQVRQHFVAGAFFDFFIDGFPFAIICIIISK